MVLAFVNTEVSQATGLVANMQKLVNENKDAGLRAFVIFQGGAELKDPIQKLAAEKGISIPMAYMENGRSDSGLKMYKINPEATSTILVNNQKRVTANFVNVEPEKFEQVAVEAKKVLAPSE